MKKFFAAALAVVLVAIAGSITALASGEKKPSLFDKAGLRESMKELDQTPAAVSMAEVDPYAAEVFRLVNVERKKAGLNEVEWVDDFYVCSQLRAQELTQKFSHTRPVTPKVDKSWPMNVNGKGEYNAPSIADELGIPYNWVMENAGMGHTSPEAVVKSWMNSSGHRANILREQHNRGAAGYYGGDGVNTYGHYWILWLDS